MLEQFIGEEVVLEWVLDEENEEDEEQEEQEENEQEEGILLYARKSGETDEYILVSIFKNDGEIEEYAVGDTTNHEGIKYNVKLYIKDHKNIRNKMLNIPKPQKVTRAELIDMED